MKQSYLVTGGAGFIGSHTVDLLLEKGEEVTVLDIVPKNKAKNLEHVIDSINYIEGDVTVWSDVFLASQGKDYIIHLAADVSVPYSIEHPIETHNTNVNGTLNVMKAAEEAGVNRLVFASSAAVYGNTDNLPVKESISLRPQSPYALHKEINEQYGRYFSNRGKLEVVGLRYFNVFGSRQDPSSPYSGVISLCRKHLLDEKVFTIFGDGEQTRDFVSVYDVATANILATKEGASGEVYNIASGTEVSLNELIEEINEISDMDLKVDYAESRPGDIKRSFASIEKAKNELGYKPTHERKEVLSELITN